MLKNSKPEVICKNYIDAAFTNFESDLASLKVQADSYKMEVERISKQLLAEIQSY